jgi:hypothetical protein
MTSVMENKGRALIFTQRNRFIKSAREEWQNSMRPDFPPSNLVPVPVLSYRVNALRRKSGECCRQGSGYFVAEVDKSHSSSFVASKP